MKRAALLAALLVASSAYAAGFAPFSLADSGETCYTWTGGNYSAGSFSKCSPVVVVAQASPARVVAPAPLAAAPVCPPQITVIPEPHKPRILRKRPPPAKC